MIPAPGPLPMAVAAGLLLAAVPAAADAAASPSGAVNGPAGHAAAPAVPRADADPAEDPALARYYQQDLTWRSCRGGMRCTTLTVPLDYADPTLGDVGIKVLKAPRSDDADRPRIGSLVINPGGPGGSGVDYASWAPFIFSPDVTSSYDVIGFDPRGVGASDPVDCLTDTQLSRWLDENPAPTTPAQRRSFVALAPEMGDGCQRRSPRITDHMDTDLVARDVDVLRAALGDEVLHYFGFSYGTAIGATYADLFPTRAGRLVLDGALDPTLDYVSLSHGQSDGFQVAVRRFVEDCVPRRDCPLPAGTGRALNRLQRFLAGLADNPLPATRNRPLVEAQAVMAVIGSMYDPSSGWPSLRSALRAGFDGRGRPLQQINDGFVGRRPNGSYSGNANEAIYAVNCWDYPKPPGPRGTRELADRWGRAADLPVLAQALAWGVLPCHYWPGRTSVAPHPVQAPGAPPILVVGTTWDPATPVIWARSLAEQLESGVYLEWRGDGHTAYGRGGRCPTEAIDRFLVEGVPPADGKVCR